MGTIDPEVGPCHQCPVRCWLLILLFLGACEPSRPPPALPEVPVAPKRSVVRLAGDAVTTPLVERLVKVYSVRERGPAIQVEAPIGVGGATRALADGVIDGALVALPSTSRPPAGAVRIARSRVVLAVGRGGKARRAMSGAELARIIDEADATWANGLPRRVLLRPADDPLQLALSARLPAVGAALARAFEQESWPIYAQADALRSALRVTPGAVAVSDQGSLGLHGLPVWPVRIGKGVFVDLWLRPGREAGPRLQAFMAWLSEPESQELVRGLGYATVDPRRRP